MLEFTGERVIPGLVEPDLWNEHLARYLFAARLAGGKRVLDLACGTGYGAAELARSASHVFALDIAAEALNYARAHYQRPNLHFAQADCRQAPLPDSSFDLIVAFELIEHLSDSASLLREARRLLAPSGQFVVSTPNRDYYEQTRQESGPNPFHRREFAYDEFVTALREFFPYTALFVQNHADGIVFRPVTTTTSAELRLESKEENPAESHFFVGVCALRPQLGSPAFVFLPSTANILRERELHIEKLESEVAAKTRWLNELETEHKQAVDRIHALMAEVDEKNAWAQRLNEELAEATERLTRMDETIRGIVAAYDAKIAELEKEMGSMVAWVRETEDRLAAKSEELVQCLEMLHRTEQELEERTRWALDLDKARQNLESRLHLVQASRWYRLGRTFGLGPELRNS